jgi:hypothetical protein
MRQERYSIVLTQNVAGRIQSRSDPLCGTKDTVYVDLIQHLAGRIQYTYRSDSVSGRRIQFRSDPISGTKDTA